MHSSSEYQRISLSTSKVTSLACRLDLPDSAREKEGIHWEFVKLFNFFTFILSEVKKINSGNLKYILLTEEEKNSDEEEDNEESEEDEDEENEKDDTEEECRKSDNNEEKEEEENKFEEKEKILSDDPPLINGSLLGRLKPLENGVDDDKLDFSIGDITVDSVKEHIT